MLGVDLHEDLALGLVAAQVDALLALLVRDNKMEAPVRLFQRALKTLAAVSAFTATTSTPIFASTTAVSGAKRSLSRMSASRA